MFRVVEPEELQFPDTMLRFSLCTRGMQREILLRSLPFLSFKRDIVYYFWILLNLDPPALEFYTEWLSKGLRLGAA